MKTPLTMDLKKIGHNAHQLVSRCHAQGITAMGITKGCCGSHALAQTFADAGMDYLADSRIENLIGLSDMSLPKVLLRLPKPSEAQDVIRYTDYSLNSELSTLRALSSAAVHQKKTHHVILMIDLGDLREGIFYGNQSLLEDTVRHTLSLPSIDLCGLGVNFTCYGGVIPTRRSYGLLLSIADDLRRRFSIPLPMVSGGNSSSMLMLLDGSIPVGINNVRINQAVLLGRELAQGTLLPGWHTDAFILSCEVIEVQVKPSLPIGPMAKLGAFGPPTHPQDMGVRRRAVLALGRQDMDYTALKPRLPGAFVTGASSDHLIVDVTACTPPPVPGEMMSFTISTYSGVLSAMASPYIDVQPI